MDIKFSKQIQFQTPKKRVKTIFKIEYKVQEVKKSKTKMCGHQRAWHPFVVCSCGAVEPPTASRRNGSHCTVGVLPGPTGVMTHSGWWATRAPTLCMLWLRCRAGELRRASSCHEDSTAWNCGVANLCADSHDMSTNNEKKNDPKQIYNKVKKVAI